MTNEQEAPQAHSGRRFNRFWTAVLWIGVIAFAIYPLPWV
jgi:hypothetical protein